MKLVKGLILAGAVLALATGCSGKASPEAEVSCVNGVDITHPSALGVGFYLVQKGITANDTGLGGAVPANGLTATVKSPVEQIQICNGDCLDGSGSFDVTQDVETDDDAVMIYTLGIDGAGGPITADVLESFNAQSQCITSVSVT